MKKFKMNLQLFAEQGNRTFMKDLVDPEVLATMVSGKVDKYIRVTPFAKIDSTLAGQAGTTITVPFYGHIGNAVVVAEGEEIPVKKLTTSTKQYTIHKIGNGVTITDEAMLSAYGDPVGEAAKQLAQSIAQKVDQDAIDELYKAENRFLSTTQLKYTAVVDAIDLFNEELNTTKIMFINPSQVKTLRKDSDFLSADKYGVGTNVIMYGEIGLICNAHIVVTKRVAKNPEAYYKVESTVSGALTIVEDSTSSPTASQVKLSEVQAKAIYGYTPSVGDSVLKMAEGTYWINPIVRIVSEDEVETGIPAITIYTKRDTDVEPDREPSKKQTSFYADKHFVVALTNAAEVVLLYSKVSA